MDKRTICLTLILTALWIPIPGQARADQSSSRAGVTGYAPAGEAWYPQDPADSLYRAARAALNRGDYEQAARMFRDVADRYRRSSYAGDALYYRAFALYRLGEDEDLRQALAALRLQQERYSGASTRSDAEALRARIDGELARLGDPEAAERVAREAELAVRIAAGVQAESQARGAACPDEDNEIRVAALNALLQMNARQALPILKEVLKRRDECSVPIREKAVFLVSQKRSDETVEIMLDVARNDPEPEIRKKAVFWLSQVPGEASLTALVDILENETNTRIQEKAIFALSQHAAPRAGRALRDYAMREDAPADLREKAVFWIGQRGDGEGGEFLRQLYRSTDSRELKEKIIFGLAQQRGNAEWLLEVARDQSEPLQLRTKAIFWAGQGGASIGQLGQLYESFSEREVKEQIIFALSQSGESEAVDRLMDIARNEEDPELRKKAVFWLGQSDDPRVANFLLELISQ